MRFFSDKHLVEIGEPLETFVLNMNDRGLTSAQTAAKSGIPLNTVNEIPASKKGVDYG